MISRIRAVSPASHGRILWASGIGISSRMPNNLDGVLNESAALPRRLSVLGRTDSVLPNELPREVALIAEAGGHRDLAEAAAGAHEPLRELETALHDVRVRCQSELASEAANQLIAAETSGAGQL